MLQIISSHISSPCPRIKLSKPLKFSWMLHSRAEVSASAIHFPPNTALLIHRYRRAVALASEEPQFGLTDDEDEPRQRKVVEHICLLKAKEDLSEKQENDMLDYLYTTQYQMSGIIAISLGRISDPNPEQYTHAVFMRFQCKEDLIKFYENQFYVKVLNEHVMPYCHGIFNFNYASEVEDDILPIFRKGEEYSYGVEFVLLLQFSKSSLGGPAEDATTSLVKLALQFPSLIVQATSGPNINTNTIDQYTHGVVIRFRSSEAFKMFTNSSEYLTLWKSKFQPFMENSLSSHYSVDPIAKELM